MDESLPNVLEEPISKKGKFSQIQSGGLTHTASTGSVGTQTLRDAQVQPSTLTTDCDDCCVGSESTNKQPEETFVPPSRVTGHSTSFLWFLLAGTRRSIYEPLPGSQCLSAAA